MYKLFNGDSSMKVLFIPINSIQSELFIGVIAELKRKNVDTKFISLDSVYKKRWPNYLAEPLLEKFNLQFTRIENFTSPDPKIILKNEKPDIIVNSQDAMDPIIQQLMTTAEKLKIPGLVIQDAFMFYPEPPYNSPEQKAAKTPVEKITAIARDMKSIFSITDYGYSWKMKGTRIYQRLEEIMKGSSSVWGDGTYTKIAVMGDYTKNLLLSRGIDNSKIVITGEPRWDSFVSFRKFDMKNNKLVTKYDLNPTKKNILLTTTPLVESKMWTEKDREYYITNIIKAIQKRKEFHLLIKLHPRDTSEAYENIIKKHGLNKQCSIFHTVSTSELIKCCDLLLVHICTTALEAMILNKPVIAVDFKYTTAEIPYVKDGAAIGVDYPEDLLKSIENALFDPVTKRALRKASEKFVYKCAYKQDGKASKRVADLVFEMLETNRRPKDEKRKKSNHK
jgi:glycosyltransferase involved in cell wall biosynthesis